jgi:hypothetical protein
MLIRFLKKELTFEMYKDNAVCANGAMYRKDVRGFLPELMEKCMGNVSSSKRRCSKQSRSYEKLQPNFGKRLRDVITFRWLRRLLLIALMVPSVTSTFDITNLQTQKRLHSLVKSLFVGLREG